jgi:urease accessory protein
VIAVSAVVLGSLVLLAVRFPLAAAVVLVGSFAVFHGHAHGIALPAAASPVSYAAGFVVATGLLHLGGIGLAALVRWPAGVWAVRASALGVASVGLIHLLG